jgi:tetratricopeptide (TPR) repeat protein
MVLLFLTLLSSSAFAQPSPAAFETANKLYEQGKFSEAATGYESLLKSGQASPAVYFNLGNACFKAGQIGRAVAAYRKAGQTAPRDPDVQANLKFARNQVQGPTLSPTGWERLLGRLSLNEWSLLAAGAVWLWFLLLTLLQWRPALKPSLRGWVITLGLAAAVFCGGLVEALRETRFTRSAIVVATEAVVRQSPYEDSKNAFTAHDGAELRVLDQKDDWLQVSAGPRFFGWLRRDQVIESGT